MRIMLIPHRCFSCCSVVLNLSQGLLDFPCSATKEVHRSFGGGRARTADPKWPKEYFLARSIVLSVQTGEVPVSAAGQTGHQSACAEQWLCSSLTFIALSLAPPFSLLLPLSVLLLLSSLSFTLVLCFLNFPPHPTVG